MPARDELAGFIRSHFPSVWSLELLLHLRSGAGQPWSKETLVTILRASDAIITTSVDALVAGGLVVTEQGDAVRFSPATKDLARLVGEVAELYAKKPDAVRRLIVLSPARGLTAFADAFNLRRDQ